jgi:hypothetical protein
MVRGTAVFTVHWLKSPSATLIRLKRVEASEETVPPKAIKVFFRYCHAVFQGAYLRHKQKGIKTIRIRVAAFLQRNMAQVESWLTS